jgi:hypothetical protein
MLGVLAAQLIGSTTPAQATHYRVRYVALGRIERSLFTLQWLSDPALHHRSHVGLNKGEASNALRRAVFFHRQGEFRDRTFGSGGFRLIPGLADQNPCAQSRRPREMTVQGCATSLFQTWQQ